MNLVFASGFLLPQHLGNIDYFKGVESHVTTGGHRPLFHIVPPFGTSKVRAAGLAGAIRDAIQNQTFDQGPIHIIAHSMGGLDSRYLIAGNPDLAARIRSLTTLSTPHHGSPIADLLAGNRPIGISFLRRRLFDNITDAIGIIDGIGGRKIVETGAIGDLTRERAEAAPNVAKTHAQIAYFSYAASGRASGLPTSVLLSAGYAFILSAQGGGPNDGAVPVASANYGDFQETWDCDHLDMVGHNLDPIIGSRFLHLDAYDRIINKLQALPPKP